MKKLLFSLAVIATMGMITSCGGNSKTAEDQTDSQTESTEVDEAQVETAASVKGMQPGTKYVWFEVSNEDPDYCLNDTTYLYLTIYNDNTVSGKMINVMGGTKNAISGGRYEYTVTGDWEDQSIHDKPFKVLDLYQKVGENYPPLEMKVNGRVKSADRLFIDEDMNAFIGDVDSTPLKFEVAKD